jgi:5-dehydro-4-deoxyglucarate dehydratase
MMRRESKGQDLPKFLKNPVSANSNRRDFLRAAALLVAGGTQILSAAPAGGGKPAGADVTASKRDRVRRLSGVHNFMVTPFRANYDLDASGLRENVADHAAGFHDGMVIVVSGGLGEIYSLTVEEHQSLVEAAVEGAASSMPVVAGVGGGYRNALRMAVNAEKAGADAVLVFPPASRWGPFEGTHVYCRDVAEAVQIDVLIYPRQEEYWPRLLRKLAELPNVIGFKDPSGKVSVGEALKPLVPDEFLWIAEGENHAVKALPAGARAYTTAIATFLPEVSHQFWTAGVAGNVNAMEKMLKDEIESMVQVRSLREGYGISGIKVALEALGRAGGLVRPPSTQVAPEDRAKIAKIAQLYAKVRRGDT